MGQRRGEEVRAEVGRTGEKAKALDAYYHMTLAPYPIYLCTYIRMLLQMDGSLFERVQAAAVQSVELGVVCKQEDYIGQGVLRLQLKGALSKGRGRCEVGQVVCMGS